MSCLIKADVCRRIYGFHRLSSDPVLLGNFTVFNSLTVVAKPSLQGCLDMVNHVLTQCQGVRWILLNNKYQFLIAIYPRVVWVVLPLGASLLRQTTTRAPALVTVPKSNVCTECKWTWRNGISVSYYDSWVLEYSVNYLWVGVVLKWVRVWIMSNTIAVPKVEILGPL